MVTVAGDGWKRRIRMREIYRYMAVKESGAEEDFRRQTEAQLARLLATVRPRTFYQVYPLTELSPGVLKVGEVTFESRDLSKNLRGCDHAALMGMTLGVETDRLIYRLQTSKVGEALITDACAAEVVEAVCDELCDGMKARAAERAYGIRPRFSPGYGDLSLACQKEIFRVLELPRRIGVTLTEGGMMTPVKSVTAVVGFYPLREAGLP